MKHRYIHRASKYENILDEPSTCGCVRLTGTEQRTLNATIDRLNLGYSAFDTTIQVPKRTARHTHEMAVTSIFSRENYPVYTRNIDHTPG